MTIRVDPNRDLTSPSAIDAAFDAEMLGVAAAAVARHVLVPVHETDGHDGELFRCSCGLVISDWAPDPSSTDKIAAHADKPTLTEILAAHARHVELDWRHGPKPPHRAYTELEHELLNEQQLIESTLAQALGYRAYTEGEPGYVPDQDYYDIGNNSALTLACEAAMKVYEDEEA